MSERDDGLDHRTGELPPRGCELCEYRFFGAPPCGIQSQEAREACAERVEGALEFLGYSPPIVIHSTFPLEIGRCLRQSNGEVVVPFVVRRRPLLEHGFSEAHAGDWGTLYESLCRPASAEEVFHMEAHESQRKRAPSALHNHHLWTTLCTKILVSSVLSCFTYPEGREWPENHPASADYLVIEPDAVWLVTHGGRTGETWGHAPDLPFAIKAPITSAIRPLLVRLGALAA